MMGHIALAFSPDGTTLAASGQGTSLNLWDTATWASRRVLEGDTATGRRRRFLAGRAAPGHGVRRRNHPALGYRRTGTIVWTIQGHTRQRNAVAFAPDGRRIASGGEDRLGQGLGCDDRRRARQLLGPRPLACATWRFRPTASTIASVGGTYRGPDAAEVKLWDSQTGHETASLIGHTSLVTAVAYFPGGRRLATASDDRTIKLWDTTTHEDVFTLRGHTSGVVSLAISRDGRQIVSGSIDYSAKTWSTATPDPSTGRRALAPPRRRRARSVALCQALAQGRRARGTRSRQELEPAVSGGRDRDRRAPHRECLGTLHSAWLAVLRPGGQPDDLSPGGTSGSRPPARWSSTTPNGLLGTDRPSLWHITGRGSSRKRSKPSEVSDYSVDGRIESHSISLWPSS